MSLRKTREIEIALTENKWKMRRLLGKGAERIKGAIQEGIISFKCRIGEGVREGVFKKVFIDDFCSVFARAFLYHFSDLFNPVRKSISRPAFISLLQSLFQNG